MYYQDTSLTIVLGQAFRIIIPHRVATSCLTSCDVLYICLRYALVIVHGPPISHAHLQILQYCYMIHHNALTMGHTLDKYMFLFFASY
jgi:hypothetical protein